jgi:hypothetical protein
VPISYPLLSTFFAFCSQHHPFSIQNIFSILTMSTRKRKQDAEEEEEFASLPEDDESEEE